MNVLEWTIARDDSAQYTAWWSNTTKGQWMLTKLDGNKTLYYKPSNVTKGNCISELDNAWANKTTLVFQEFPVIFGFDIK